MFQKHKPPPATKPFRAPNAACVSETQCHYAPGVEAILAFGAALLALPARRAARRRAGARGGSRTCSPGARASPPTRSGPPRSRRGAAAGWNEGSFRAYYLFGGLLTAALLGAGSLLLARRADRRARSRSSTSGSRSGSRSPYRSSRRSAAPRSRRRRSTWRSSRPGSSRSSATSPARSRSSSSRSAGFRRRPLGNALLLAGFATAAAGSALAGLGAAADRRVHRRRCRTFVCRNRCAHANGSYLLQTGRLLA